MWLINCLLLIIGSVAAVCGLSFYVRNRDATGNIRFFICSYGLSAAHWCLFFALIGFCDDFETCSLLRSFGDIGINTFLITEVFLVTGMSGANSKLITLARFILVLASIADYVIFSQDKVNIFFRKDGWTTWYANPDMAFNRSVHSAYIALVFLVLISFWAVWVKNNKLQRIRRFLMLLLFANCIMLSFTLPDTFLPAMGKPAVSTSGIGAALCAIVMWYGATRLYSFDIRMGNIKDRIFDFVEVGIALFDMDCNLAVTNRYTKNLLDWKENKKYRLYDFFNLENDTDYDVFNRSLNDIYSARLWDNSGTKAFSVRFHAVKDDYGEPFCFMCVFADVTEEVEAISKFKIASSAKSTFLAQMSHEIRTPINAVLGMNEMILREASDPEILEYAENINSSGNTLLSLINSILDFSKIEDGKMEIIDVQYDTALFINGIVKSITNRIDSKGLKFELDIDETLPCALIGDDVRLSQIILNLLTNAVKYTEKGRIYLQIKTQERTDRKIKIHVLVKDTGIGIKEEDINRLFISFERLDEVRNHNIEGTGLGISIVTSLLNMMGSRLEVESNYGVGSSFSFVIEQRIEDSAPIGNYEKRLKENHIHENQEDVVSAPGAKILIVDDNEMNLKVATNLLRLCSVIPDTAKSGSETIEIMRDHTYDIVFLDHMMPELDGIETLKILQKENLIPDQTTMIALTANALTGAKETYLKAGFNDYMSKPIEIRDLVEKLTKYLPRSIFEAGDSESISDYEILEFEPDDQNAIIKDTETADPEKKYDLKKLNDFGINTQTGISYCAQKEDLYFEMLNDYIDYSGEKLKALNSHYGKKDWHQYEITVHSLKSNAKTVGSAKVSDAAMALEQAAKQKDITYIDDHHTELVHMIEELTAFLRTARYD